MARTVLITVLGVVAVSFTATAQAPKVSDVAARVGDYVAEYHTQLVAVVAEERYTQTVDPGVAAERLGAFSGTPYTDGPAGRQSAISRPPTKRILRSDYALTPVVGRGYWVGYRDTFDVDGRAVRDREERLQQLLASGAVGQAARIAEQNARFNLAGELLTRNINVPTFALELLHPRRRVRFSVRQAGSEIIDGREAWVLEFRERAKPTIVRTPDGRDQPSRVLAVVDPKTGIVWQTTLSWEKLPGSVVVHYGLVSGISALVPLSMSERYTTRGGTAITGDAIYSNYRQFQTDARVIDP